MVYMGRFLRTRKLSQEAWHEVCPGAGGAIRTPGGGFVEGACVFLGLENFGVARKQGIGRPFTACKVSRALGSVSSNLVDSTRVWNWGKPFGLFLGLAGCFSRNPRRPTVRAPDRISACGKPAAAGSMPVDKAGL